MMSNLPYVTATGNVEKALRGIQSASQPEKVTQDFVKTILQIKGGSGDQITSFLKKIGFANPDGTPTDIYKKFRNPSTAGRAAAEALKTGYAPLFVRNEYMHKLSDQDLKGLIIEETGQSTDSSVVGLVFSCIKSINKFADWNSTKAEPETEKIEKQFSAPVLPNENFNVGGKSSGLGMNLSYTINLNLPATSDPAVFNAIFKSLKENLLKDSDG